MILSAKESYMRLKHTVLNNKKICLYIYDINYSISKISFMRYKLKPNTYIRKQ